jgi:hypothetical protein
MGMTDYAMNGRRIETSRREEHSQSEFELVNGRRRLVAKNLQRSLQHSQPLT